MARTAARRVNPRQQRFIEEFLVCLNGTAAYQRAGFRVKSAAVAAVNAHRLLKKPHIAAAVQARIAERTERTQERAMGDQATGNDH